MPLPKPRPGEKKEAFIARCMSDEKMGDEYPDEAQRKAVCFSQWLDGQSDGNSGIHLPLALKLSGPKHWAVEKGWTERIFPLAMSTGQMHPADMDMIEKTMVSFIKNFAIVDVRGVFMHDADWFDMFFGGVCDYERVCKVVSDLADDSTVSGIIVNIDSPGGECQGMLGCAEAIRALCDKKPIWAFTQYTMASAAYAIGSACEKVFVAKDAMVGSIGVKFTHCDFSPGHEGYVNITEFTSGEWKALGTPNRAMTPEEKAKIQSDVDTLASLFFASVSKHRGIPVETISGFQADVFMGATAVENGLADGLAASVADIVDMMRLESDQEEGKMAKPFNDKFKRIKARFPGFSPASILSIMKMAAAPETKSECEAAGGEWDEEKGTCTLPESEDETAESPETGGGGKKNTKVVVDIHHEAAGRSEKRIESLESALRKTAEMGARHVWEQLFAGVSLSDGMKADLAVMVPHTAFVKDNVLDVDAFRKAAKAKLDEWGKTSTIGFGSDPIQPTAEAKNDGYYKDLVAGLKG